MLPLAAASLVFVLLVGAQLWRPLMYDDANFYLAGKAVAETGLPFGNQGWMSDRDDYSQREQWALWHPPLYVYLLGVLARLGGASPAVMRLPGILAGVATGALTAALAHQLTRGSPEQRSLAASLAGALVLLCPLTVQSALILDIDFPVLVPLTLLFVLLYLRLEASRLWPVLIPLFGLLLWAKMTNPVPLLAIVVVWQTLRGKYRRALRDLVAIGLGGGALFLATWVAATKLLGFPFDMPFEVNLVQWQASADVARQAYTSPGAFIAGLANSVLWLGPGLVGLGLLGVAWRCATLVCEWRIRTVDVLIGLLIVLVLGYVNKSAGWFPKYQVGIAPLLAVLGAPVVARAWRGSLGPLLVVFGCAAFVVDRALVSDSWALQRTWAIDPTPAAWLLALFAIALAWRRYAAPAGLAAIALGWSLSTDLTQATAQYSTGYWYGTTGTVEAARWVDANLPPGNTYVASKEVAIRARDNQRYVDQESLMYLFTTGTAFYKSWAGQPIPAVIAWQREPYVADLVRTSLHLAGYQETARFGDYVIYEPA